MTDNYDTGVNFQKQGSASASFGRVLATGNGHGNPALLLQWAGFIVCALIFCVAFASLAHYTGRDAADLAKRKHAMYTRPTLENIAASYAIGSGAKDLALISQVMTYCAILWPILMLVAGIIGHRSIVGTYIQVAENGIEGKGQGKGFRLTYSQITSVDVVGTKIIIHASSAKYICYVAKPAEIQRVIFEQQQRRVS